MSAPGRRGSQKEGRKRERNMADNELVLLSGGTERGTKTWGWERKLDSQIVEKKVSVRRERVERQKLGQ